MPLYMLAYGALYSPVGSPMGKERQYIWKVRGAMIQPEQAPPPSSVNLLASKQTKCASTRSAGWGASPSGLWNVLGTVQQIIGNAQCRLASLAENTSLS